ncbi:hypothetical protein IJT17_06870 [bacterium]|nr:hypothetical protein [bacterium]
MAKRIFFGVAIVCVLIVGFVIFMPETRQELFGIRLAHSLQAGKAENVVTVAQLLSGTEIRPISEDGSVLPSSNVNTENYDVRLGLQESIQSVGSEDVVSYSVSSVESEQIGTSGAGDMIHNVYRLRLFPSGLPVELKRTEGKLSRAVTDLCMTQIMGAWWPEMPSKRVRKGDSWSGRWNVPYVLEVLDGKKISLCHEVQYFLDDVRSSKGLNIAHVTYKGTVAPADLGELPKDTEIAGTGMIAGEVYINVANGQSCLADERLIWSVAVRLRQDNMEIVQFADRNSRTYRPRYLPHGDAGFTKKAPGGTSQEGLPTAGELMKTAPAGEATGAADTKK